jgi:hypothetical protein
MIDSLPLSIINHQSILNSQPLCPDSFLGVVFGDGDVDPDVGKQYAIHATGYGAGD